MHYQHRGQPSRPKMDHHTRWANDEPDMPGWVWVLIPIFFVGLWVCTDFFH